jgi:hypothetical protein
MVRDVAHEYSGKDEVCSHSKRDVPIYLLGNLSCTPSSIFFNDIQYCLFISQGPCGSCTSANFISIRQNFPCFLSPSKYSQNCFVIRRRSIRKTIRENSCCLPSVPFAFSKENQHLNIIGSSAEFCNTISDLEKTQ